MALNYQKLFLLGKKLKYNDPEFTFTFVSNDLNLQGKKWSNMYLFPTSETDDEMRIDFAVGENLQTRIKNYGKSFNHNGAFYLMPNENSATNFYLDDSDGMSFQDGMRPSAPKVSSSLREVSKTSVPLASGWTRYIARK